MPRSGIADPASTISWPSWLRTAFRLIGVGVAYALAHQIAYFFPDAEGIMMAIWPAGGIGLAALLLAPKREWPQTLLVLFLAGNLANLTAGRSVIPSLGFMAANVLESFSCAWLIRWGAGELTGFSRVREVAFLLLGATVVNAGTALMGAGAAKLVSAAPWREFYLTWWVADALGILLVTPLVICLWARSQGRGPHPYRRRLEAVLLFGLTSALTWFAFGPTDLHFGMIIRPYMLLGIVIWAAFRFGTRGTTLLMAAVAGISLYLTVTHQTLFPLGGHDPTRQLRMVQAYLVMMGVTGMLLAASYAEQKATGSLLRESQARYAATFHSSGIGLTISSAEGGFVEVNDAFCKLAGYERGELLGHSSRRLNLWVDMQQREALIRALRLGEANPCREVQMRCRSGEQREVIVGLKWLQLGGADCVLSSVIDITDRKRVEAAVHDLHAQATRDARIKMELLKEINHRVKNNLSSILGLLVIERRQASPENRLQVEPVLGRLAERVRSLLDVHQLLAESQWGPVRLTDLADRIIRGVLATLPDGESPELVIPPSSVRISPRQASSLALVLNELATNSLKHTSPERLATQLGLQVQSDPEAIKLEYRDNGSGYPPSILNGAATTVGMSLVRQLVTESLRGSLQLSNDDGAVARLLIRPEEPTRT
jgi:PAS domain S-box-containing protein